MNIKYSFMDAGLAADLVAVFFGLLFRSKVRADIFFETIIVRNYRLIQNLDCCWTLSTKSYLIINRSEVSGSIFDSDSYVTISSNTLIGSIMQFKTPTWPRGKVLSNLACTDEIVICSILSNGEQLYAS